MAAAPGGGAVGEDEPRAKSAVLPLVALAVFHASPRVRARAVESVRKLAFVPVGSGTPEEDNLFDALVRTMVWADRPRVVMTDGQPLIKKRDGRGSVKDRLR